MTALSWIADTTTKLALGVIIGAFFKTWFDTNMTLRLREHKNASHLRELHQQGVQLRLHFMPYKQDDPITRHPELAYAYDDWNHMCEQWLSVLSPRWYESWVLSTTIMATDTSIDPSAVSTAFAFLVKRVEWLEQTRTESFWRWAWLWESFPLRLLMVRWKLGLYRRPVVQRLRLK
jgi:hypothetical protein